MSGFGHRLVDLYKVKEKSFVLLSGKQVMPVISYVHTAEKLYIQLYIYVVYAQVSV